MTSILPGRRTAISVPSERPKGSFQPSLVVIAGSEIGRRIELGDGEVAIGRSEQCEICVPSDQVSRRHASVQRVLGRYYIIDLRSTNGTFVNDQRVERAALADGDHIRIGKTVLKYTESPVELQYFDHVYNLASIDALTNAFNKRYFDEAFAKAVARAQHGGAPLSLILFDIDFFKKINDGYGHPAGDAVLKNVAETVQAQLRDGDELCRVGGEEFALVMNDTPLELARRAAEVIRGAVEATVTHFEGTPISATLSLGVVMLSSDDSATQLYQRADQNLYEAKRSGRNRVIG